MEQPDHGIDPASLDDPDLRRQLQHLHETRHDALLSGSEAAFETHTRRMLALEDEFLRRLPREAGPDPRRTRAGRREGAPAGDGGSGDPSDAGDAVRAGDAGPDGGHVRTGPGG